MGDLDQGIATLVAAIIAAIISIVIGGFNIRMTLYQSKKKDFVSTITNARKEYMAELRKAVADFCAAAVAESNDSLNLIRLSFHLKMLMNPIDYPETWDGEAIQMIDKIILEEDKRDNISQFVVLMQACLALEWKGMTIEGEKGILTEEEKEDLRDEAYWNLENYRKLKVDKK